MFTCHLFSPLFPSYCTADWPRLLFPSLQRTAGAGRAPQRTASARTAGRPAGTPRSGAYLVGHGPGLGARLRTPGQAFSLRSIVCPASNALHRQSDSGIGGPGPPQPFWGKALLLEPLCPGLGASNAGPHQPLGVTWNAGSWTVGETRTPRPPNPLRSWGAVRAKARTGDESHSRPTLHFEQSPENSPGEGESSSLWGREGPTCRGHCPEYLRKSKVSA